MRISRIVSLLLIISVLSHPLVVLAADTEQDFNTTKSHIDIIQAPSPTLPDVPLQRGRMGDIMSRLFDPQGRIGNWYIKALRNVENDAIMRWNGGKGGMFMTGSIFDTGTNVGIGTSSPSSKLEVAGNQILSGDARRIFFGSTGTYIGELGTSNKLELSGGGSAPTDSVFIDSSGRIGIGNPNPAYDLDISGNINFTGDFYRDGSQVNFAGKFSDGTDPDDAVYTTGNVGIGKTNPGYPLDVVGDTQLSANLFFTGAGSHYIKHQSGTAASDRFVFRFSDNEDVLAVRGDGRVGIGTVTPSQALEIAGGNILLSNNQEFRFLDSGGTQRTALRLAADDDLEIWNSAGDILFEGGGNVGIGLSTPTHPLSITANTSAIDVLAADNEEILTSRNDSATGDPDQFFLRHNLGSVEIGNSRGNIYFTSGNIGIGTGSTSELLTVAGGLSIASDPDTDDDVGNRGYSDTRYINVGEAIPGDDIIDGTVDGSEIGNDSITNIDINSAAAIAGTKISPNFGAQNIITTGNVGIGTSSPDGLLHIGNATRKAYFEEFGGSSFRLSGGNSSAASAFDINALGASGVVKFSINTTEAMRINSAGNVGIGTTTPTEKLQVVGRISVTNDPNTGDDVGDRDYNDGRYINVGESINGDDITDGTIDSSEIQNNTLTAADLAPNSVGTSEIADNAITTAKILDGQVINADLGTNAVTNVKILDGTIINADLANNAITSAKIQDGQVLSADIGLDTIVAADIATDAIGAAELANNSVQNSNIVDGTILNADINASAAIAGTKISPNFGSQNIILSGSDIDFTQGNTSNIRSLGSISFDWTAGSYDNPEYHGIESQNETGNLADSLRINSYSDIINTIDSNANSSSKFVIQKESAGNGTDLFTINESGNAVITGTATAAEPTASTHLTTKNYVDTLVTQGVSWKAPVPTGSTPAGTYGACDAAKEGWATYDIDADAVYVCNASAWVVIGSTASVPYATTASPGKIQIAGDIQGTWNNVTLKDSIVDSANIVNGTITNTDIAATNSITADRLAANSVGASEIAANAVGNSELIDQPTVTNLNFDAVHGNGIKFWGNDAYKIYMSSAGNGTWGGRLDAASDYNMYFKMTGGTNRGFVFKNDTTDVAQIEGNGNIRTTGSFIGNGSQITNLNASNLSSGTVPDARLSGNVVLTSGNQTIGGTKTFSSTISGNINGNATTATALQTARNIAVSGDVTGTASFNGTSNISIASTIANNAITSAKIQNGQIVNADINASAAIAGTKISPDFGNQNITINNNRALSMRTSGGNARSMVLLETDDNLRFGNTGAGDGNDTISFNITGNADVLNIDSSGNVGIGTTTPTEKLQVVGRISVTNDPNTGDDVGDRDYNDGRYINVGESINGDDITDGTIDSSEIQNNTLTASDLAPDSVGASELANNSVASANIINNTITETDISDTFVARAAAKVNQGTAYTWIGDLNGTPRSMNSNQLSVGFVRNTTNNAPIAYGMLLNVPSYTSGQDGGAGQILFPYDQGYTGNGNPMFRVGDYNNAGWASWKTFLDKDWGDSIYINVGESINGDDITDGTIDSSEIQNNTLTAADLAPDSVGASELADNSVATANIINNTITEADISDAFVARDSNLLDGVDSTGFLKVANTGVLGVVDSAPGDTTSWPMNPTPGFYQRDYVGSSGLAFISGDVGGSTSSIVQEFKYNGDFWVHSNTDSNRWDSYRILREGSLGDYIADNTIDSSEIQNNTLTAADLAANSVANSELANNAVTTAKIQDGQVINADLGTNAVTNAKILDGTIINADLANNAITSAKIQDGQVLSADIGLDTIVAADIATDAIGAAELANNSVQNSNIVDGTIIAADIADGVITSAKITNNTITETDISDAFVARDSNLLDGIDSGSFIRSDTADSVGANTEWQDNNEVRLGAGADMRLFHNGTNSYIRNYTGNTEFRSLSHGSVMYFQGEDTGGTNRNMLRMDPDDEVQLYYAGAEKLNTTNVGINVTGTVTASDPTAGTHLTTKNYVDTLVTQGVSWKAPVPTGSTPAGTYGACDAAKEGWATYDIDADAVYVCNASAWVVIGSTASVPYATTGSPGKVQLAGDLGGTWNNVQLTNNSVSSANIINGTIVLGDLGGNSVDSSKIANNSVTWNDIADGTIRTEEIANGAIMNVDVNASAAIAGTKISPNFGSQDVQTAGNFINSQADPRIQLFETDTTDDNFEIVSNTSAFIVNQLTDGGGFISTPFRIDADAPTSGFRMLSSGNVGIGTSSPSEKLEVAGNIEVQDIKSTQGLFDITNASGNGIHLNGANVGIGTTSPSEKLEVNGNISLNELVFANLEPTNLTIDGNVGFDSSRGLIIYRTQEPGQESGDGAYTVLDTANITGGSGISISNTAAGTSGLEAITFSVSNVNGDDITDGTIDSSEIQNNTLTAADLAPNSVGNSELIDVPRVSNLEINSGNGNGIKFWSGDDRYKISMGNGGDYQYGPVTDYSIKTQIGAGAGRGFTWGLNGVAPIAAMNATTGNFQTAGDISIGDSGGTQGDLILYGTTAGKYSRFRTTNGNLHLDSGYGAGGGNYMYLNFYNGGRINFGDGASGVHSFTDTNGNWNFGNNGTFGGNIKINGNSDLSLASTGHGLTVGTTINIGIDGNEIMARNNGATSPLYIQNEGGLTTIGGGLTVNGGVISGNGSGLTSIAGDNIADNTIDSSEIQNNTIASTDILNDTITESDISNSFKARDSDKLDNINSTQFLRSDTDDSLTAAIVVPTGNRDEGMFGTYASTLTQHIWSMGTAYRNAANGANFGNLYGLAYKHTNNATGGNMAGGHQAVWAQNGVGTSAIGTNIWTSGAYIVDNTTVVDANAWIVGDRIAQNSIDSSEIQNNTLTASDLAANSVGDSELADTININSITGNTQIEGDFGRIVNSYDEWLRLNNNASHTLGVLTPSMLRADGGFQVDGVTVIGGDAWIEGDRIRQNTIDGGEIQNNTLTAADIAANAITASELAGNSVNSNKVVNDSLTAGDLAPNSVGDSELIDNPTVTNLYLGASDTRIFRAAGNVLATDDTFRMSAGSSNTIQLEDSNDSNILLHQNTSRLYFMLDSNNNLSWDEATGTHRIVMDGNSGDFRLGIGTNSPSQKLDVNGNIVADQIKVTCVGNCF